ncbi:VOC family protein [Halomicrobium salinisoli]|uniref:VOC family protein n=1 Tax=Halomicrobium salinisoli TaxID=2878391 RepID=UPI001CEFC7E8|nr:VOC family protein [Halomicrobium salinisoli]
MSDSKARLVGINHVALTVDDRDDALAFYESVFEFELRGETESSVFLDMGDQFIAISEVDDPETADEHRHFGLVVDDADAVERRLAETDAEVLDTPGLDFRDPWGNRVQVVAYEDVQFTKADHVLAGMGLDDLEKTDDAIAELAEKGMSPE